MANAGNIDINITLKKDKFVSDVNKTNNAAMKLAKTNKQLARSAKEVDNVHVSLSKSLGASAKKALLLVAAFRVTKNVVGAAITELSNMKKSVRDIEVWSKTLGIGTTRLQEFASASNYVGFSSEKTADILKDVSDKLGDFIGTGGGEARDIFRRLNIGAEQFKNLSPDKSLLRMVEAIDRLKGTNLELTKKEEVFLLEAIANDASKLIPLLRDGGKELDRLINLSKKSGKIISPEELENLKRLNVKTDQLSSSWKGLKKTITLALVDPLITAIEKLQTIIKLTGEGKDKVVDFVSRNIIPLTEKARKAYADYLSLILSPKEYGGIGQKSVVQDLLSPETRSKEELAGQAAINLLADKIGDFLNPSKSTSTQVDSSMGGVSEKFLRESGITFKDGAFTFEGAATSFGESIELFKEATNQYNKDRKPIQDILDARGQGGSARVLDKYAPEQAQSDKFDRLFNELINKKNLLGDKASSSDFLLGITQLENIMRSFQGSPESAKRGKATDQMSKMLADLKGFVKNEPKKPQAEVMIKLDKGLLAEMKKQNEEQIKIILKEEVGQAASAGGK